MPHCFARIGAAHHLLRNANDMHRAIWSLYPDYGGERPRLLYRVENWDAAALRDSGDLAPVLVLAPDPPADNGNPDITILDAKPFTPSIAEGAVLSFSVVALQTRSAINAAVVGTQPRAEWTRGSRVYLVGEEDRRRWLSRQLEPIARLLEARVIEAKDIYFAKASASGWYKTCRMFGLLEVRDPEAFIRLLEKGFGKGKAYGCGLMTIGRPS